MYQTLAKELVTTKRYGGNPLAGDWAQAEDIFPWPSVPTRIDVVITYEDDWFEPVTVECNITTLESLDDWVRLKHPRHAVSPLRNKRHRTL
jgi:hypothetical protein